MKEINVIIPLGQNREFDASESIKKHKEIDFIVERGPNPSKNRNQGIKKAKSKFVGFINGHTVLSNNWTKEVKKFFKKYPKIDVVGGPQLNYEKDVFFARISSYALGSKFGSAAVSQRYSGSKIKFDADESDITSSNLVCRKHVFKKVKFDENFYPAEDPKFISDAKKAGFKVAFSPHIKVSNRKRSTLFGLSKQIFNYGKMRPRKEGLFETIKKPYFLVPSLFVLYLVLLPLFLSISSLFWIPPVLYLILNLIFSIYEGGKNKSLLGIVLLPLIFLSIHISYGLGFIYGFLRERVFK